MSSTLDSPTQTWRLHGKALRVAGTISLLLVAGALAAAAIDLNSPLQRKPVPLELAALASKLVIVAGLLLIAQRTASISLRLLALLVGLLAVSGLLADTAAVESLADTITARLLDVLPMSERVVHTGLFFVALAVAAVALLVLAYLKAEESDRQIVMAVIVFLLLAGVFAGPINAVAAAGINREWLFAEDFGQAITLALMAGYVSGQVVATAAGQSGRVPSTV